jgi:hypothetical protein
MSFDNDLTLTDGTNTNVVSEISRVNQTTIRRDATKGLALPISMTISTKELNRNGKILYRHLVRLDEIIAYDGDDATAVASEAVYLVIERAKVITDTTTIIVKLDQLLAFAAIAANQTKVLNGES